MPIDHRNTVRVIFFAFILSVRMAAADPASDVAPAKRHSLCFEAEYANEVTPIVHVVRAKGASGEMAISVPEGAGCRRGVHDPGHAVYHLTIPADGLYYTWFRVWWQGTCSNSLFCSLQPALPRFSVMGNVFKKWHWIHGPMAQMKAGAAVMEISYREDGIWVDQVLLTTQPCADPEGIVEANTIPTPPADQGEMAVSLSSRAMGCESLPAPRLRVTSHVDHTASIPSEESVVLIPGQYTHLTVWLRNNLLAPAAGSAAFLAKAKMAIEPAASVEYRMGKGEPLAAADFRLLPSADIPRRSHRAVVRVVLPSGKVKARRLNLLCPFKWLCSEAYPLRPENGLDAPHPIEQAADPLAAGKWRAVADDCITPIGLLDMRKAVSKDDYVFAYAYTEVRPPQPGRYLLHTGNDDMIKVWVNGTMVHREDSEQPTSATRALTAVNLVEGRNRILVKLCQKRNFWEFFLEIRNADGSPSEVEGYDIQSPSPAAPK
ncbi:MAG: hypothetical protein AB1696_04910 [Planctomycetota bacterium]